MILGVDIDGVLANFESGFAPLLESIDSRLHYPVEEADFPYVWDWPSDPRYRGELSQEEAKDVERRAWNKLMASNSFWRDLRVNPGAEEFLRRLANSSHDIYFCTSRPGYTAKEQTEAWLTAHGHSNPTVLITSKKGFAARALDLDAYIDDKGENIEDVEYQWPTCDAFLLGKPYNRTFRVKHRCESLTEFLAAVRV